MNQRADGKTDDQKPHEPKVQRVSRNHKVSLWTDLTRLTLWNKSEPGLSRSKNSTKKFTIVSKITSSFSWRRLPKSIKLLIQHGRVNMSLHYDDTVQVWADQHQHDHPVWTRHRGTEPQECLFHFSWGLNGRSHQIRDTTSHPNRWYWSFSSDQSVVFTSHRQRQSLTSLSRLPFSDIVDYQPVRSSGNISCSQSDTWVFSCYITV